ncbi:MAG TPA: hypothetical protein VGJ73_04225 [Verrucomicrobiae bacterium]|jgi:Spy/CpxP family protein refolding chaperone
MKLTQAIVSSMLIVGGVVVCGPAFSQDSTNAPAPAMSTADPAAAPQTKPHGVSIEKVEQNLNLTDDQKTQVQPILEAQRQKMKELRNDSSLSTDDRRAKMKEIRKETSDQLQPILTPDQFTKWKTMNHSHKPMPQAAPDVSTNAPSAQ